MSESRPRVGVIGGTGALGSALARRWAMAGYHIIIGSRAAERAETAAAEMALPEDAPRPAGMDNASAAGAADLVVVTVPFVSQEQMLEDIKAASAGKIVVDTTVPLVPPKVMRVQLPPEGSAAARARRILGDGARLVSAFHNVAAHKLQRDAPVDCDVLVFGEPDDRGPVVELAEAAGLRGIHAGPLDNAVAAEALTSILIGINKRYKVDGAGIQITGIAAE
ncbi:NADPH-dependent F420 reductase [Dichotomicrobium thermohalophilum]|uniref:Reduced coenzyme F420:NADP oxidoreductase n=1 Tax=Dichotomicrobium thermohalophilum TaxID=933063 RepID=A0A397PF61_9HYPH|nr:NADPH-dependent F420 reductase [Dichotomicrobium thermohalophilum]RIA47652.1 reduced coenzyme F420:NADP oxidoreductase [Dichotomicrobium thermohalophilum]